MIRSEMASRLRPPTKKVTAKLKKPRKLTAITAKPKLRSRVDQLVESKLLLDVMQDPKKNQLKKKRRKHQTFKTNTNIENMSDGDAWRGSCIHVEACLDLY